MWKVTSLLASFLIKFVHPCRLSLWKSNTNDNIFLYRHNRRKDSTDRSLKLWMTRWKQIKVRPILTDFANLCQIVFTPGIFFLYQSGRALHQNGIKLICGTEWTTDPFFPWTNRKDTILDGPKWFVGWNKMLPLAFRYFTFLSIKGRKVTHFKTITKIWNTLMKICILFSKSLKWLAELDKFHLILFFQMTPYFLIFPHLYQFVHLCFKSWLSWLIVIIWKFTDLNEFFLEKC